METRGKLSKIDKAYLAGFVDGEGCIGFYIARGYKKPDGNYKYYHYIRAYIGNTDKEIPEFCKEPVDAVNPAVIPFGIKFRRADKKFIQS